MMSAEECAVHIFKAIKKRKRKIIITFWEGKVVVLVAKLWAYIIDQLLYRVFGNEPHSPLK
jgi:short-subunit dehydrogenase